MPFDASNVIASAGAVLNVADQALIELLTEMDGSGKTQTSVSVTSTTSSDVAAIAAQNQAISNAVSVASQIMMASLQNQQKLASAQTR